MLRRWLVPAVLFAVVGGLAWGATRLAPHSPIVILAVCVLAVVTMKLVEHRVRWWFRQWEERERSRARERRGPEKDGPKSEVRGRKKSRER